MQALSEILPGSEPLVAQTETLFTKNSGPGHVQRRLGGWAPLACSPSSLFLSASLSDPTELWQPSLAQNEGMVPAACWKMNY